MHGRRRQARSGLAAAALALMPGSGVLAESEMRLDAEPIALRTGSATPLLEFGRLEWLGARALPAPGEDEVPEEDADLLAHWKLQAEAGINGSSGNSENFNLRLGLNAARKTDRNETAAKVLYQYATDGGNSTQNRFETELRNDFLLAKDSPWSMFALGRFEYDEFQDWKYRTQLFGGPGYAFIRTDDMLLRGRVGAGFTKEFGGRRNELIPEGLVGVDFQWKITDRTRFTTTGEFYPSFEDSSQYRMLGRAALEIMVDPDLNLSLRIGIEDRYNSAPGPGRNRNDVDYFLTLGIAF
ncbi:MAG: YdiY family protein [Phycisphaerales bacterium]